MTNRTKKNLGKVHPVLKEIICDHWQLICEAAEIEKARIEVICGYRSQTEQDRLYAQGRTTAGTRVTWTKTSKHTSGKAVDFGCFDDMTGGYLDSENPQKADRIYKAVEKILEDEPVKSGRSFGDNPHFEML